MVGLYETSICRDDIANQRLFRKRLNNYNNVRFWIDNAAIEYVVSGAIPFNVGFI
jgi:hypothetical protein